MDSELACSTVALAKNKRFILFGGKKYHIEVTQCSADEIGGGGGGVPLLNNNAILQAPTGALMSQAASMTIPPPGVMQKMVVTQGQGRRLLRSCSLTIGCTAINSDKLN